MIVVLDTNVVSAMMRAKPDAKLVAWLDAHSKMSLWTTSVSVYEVRWGLLAMSSGARPERAGGSVRRAVAGRFRGSRPSIGPRGGGKSRGPARRTARARKIVDAKDTLIAGIVLIHAGGFATRNVRHFTDLGVRVVDPWDDMRDTDRSP
jgi:predicted nucleic acid-binding protein